MNEYREIESPAPTIVGPRSASGSAGKLSIPQGIERLITLAAISSDWRDKVLADPIAAARDARIALAPSEESILKSIPRPVLAGVVDSFARRHAPSLGRRIAAGAAAAAVLASTLTGSLDSLLSSGAFAADNPTPKPAPPAEGGVRPDAPDEAPKIAWLTSLDDALPLARKSNRAVMAVFLDPIAPARGYRDNTVLINPVQMAGNMARPVPPSSQAICQSDSKEFRLAVRDAQLLAVRITKPALVLTGNETPVEVANAQNKYLDDTEAYEGLLKKYGVIDKLPAVVFLAPDGSALSTLAKPDKETTLIDAVKAAPPLLAAWLVKNPPGPAGQTRGIQPDVPASKGVRADVPR